MPTIRWRPLWAAFVFLAVLIGAVSCGDTHQCGVAGDSLWYSLGFDVEVTSPATCPVTIYESGDSVWLEGSYFGPLSEVEYPDGQFTVAYTTAYNSVIHPVSPQFETDYYDPGTGDGESDVAFYYFAATGFNPTDSIQSLQAAIDGTATGGGRNYVQDHARSSPDRRSPTLREHDMDRFVVEQLGSPNVPVGVQ